MKKLTTLIILVMSLLVTCALMPQLGCTETQYEPGGGGAQPATEKLQITSHSMTRGEWGNLIIKGTAKNVTSSTLSYAEVKVKFYDAGGALMGTSLDNINDLSPGEVWKFEVIYFGTDDENVESYKIGVGSTF